MVWRSATRKGITVLSVSSQLPESATREDIQALAKSLIASLEEDKAEDLVVIDLEGKSSIADQMIIASGRSQRHVAAIADHIVRRLKDEGRTGTRVEGMPNADWVLIDTGDIVVHLFRPEVREFYNLERIWGTDASGHRATH
ncbi:MAG: ribosome silencing factor [Pseudomonadota bacterium]